MSNINVNPISQSLGKGLKWPLSLVNGKAELVENLDLIKQSVQIILNWYFGTRFYLGEFGTKLEQLLEEPNTQVIQTTLNYELGVALVKWEPRIKLIGTTLSNISRDHIKITINYQIDRTQLIDSFTFNYQVN
jgi:uncharacterized protein